MALNSVNVGNEFCGVIGKVGSKRADQYSEGSAGPERIPSFVRRHAVDCSCRTVARRYPELCRLFGQEEEPGAEETKETAEIANAFFARRIRSHHV